MNRSLKPSINIQAALDGAVSVSSLSKSERSAIQLHVYIIAVMVLSLPDKQSRRDKLATLPPDIKPLVEEEAKRVWLYRKQSL